MTSVVSGKPWSASAKRKRRLKQTPTIREEPSNREHHKAKWWRLHTIQMTPEQLSAKIGYAPRTIYQMELGCNSRGEKVTPRAWERYKRACASLAKNPIGFNWGQ